jgi:hypothetical protein
MPFVINAQEAQAMQEDEVQLVMALAQISQRLSVAVHSPKPPESESRQAGYAPDIFRTTVSLWSPGRWYPAP